MTHVEGRVDPIADLDIIETELMIADLESLEKRVVNLEKRAKGGDKEAAVTLRLARLALEQLNAGRPARRAEVPVVDCSYPGGHAWPPIGTRGVWGFFSRL